MSYESEDNDSLSKADAVPLDSEFKGRLSTSSDVDFYKVTATSSGSLTISFDAPTNSSSSYFQLALYDANGQLHSYKSVGRDTTVTYNGLAAGDYYYRIADGYYYSGSEYSFTPTFTASSIDDYESEDNDSLSKADAVPLDSEFKGRLSTSSDVDFYKVTATSSGSLTISFDAPTNSSSSYFQLALYDANGELHSYKSVGRDTTVTYNGLAAGDYYYRIADGYYYSGSEYSFTPTFTASSIDDYESEDNDSLSKADAVPLDSEFKGRLSTSSDVDFYKVTATSSGSLTIQL